MYDKIQLLETAISTVAPLSSPYIDAVNSFPSISILRPSIGVASRRATIDRGYISSGVTLDSFSFTVRGYVLTSIETAIEDCEALARQIETAVQSIRSPKIYSSYVTEVYTDEGLFAPYGICELRCEAEWINE